jgi:Phage phiEco32-like COOH.NH2 ligase-type 2
MPPYNPPHIWGQPRQWEAYSRCFIRRIDVAAPEPNDEEGEMLNNFRVGCDPEFILLDGNGKTVMANIHFPHDGEIGFDHNGRVAEFRPTPSRGVLPIVRKIQALVNDAKIPATAKLRAGALCNGDALGGHVHFGFNCFTEKPMDGYSILTGGGVFNAKGAQVTKALDTLTKALEHLDILPKVESTQRRGHGQGYGRYGDVRDCHGHMEYRTMASWLYDPKVAFLCLTAAKLAAVDPEGTMEALVNCDSFAKFSAWLSQYKGKDLNATRAAEKLLDKGLKYLQVDPEADFRGRWKELGL